MESGFNFHALPEERSAGGRVLAVILCLSLAVALRSAFGAWVEVGNAFAFLLPAIGGCAWLAGARWGIVSVVAAVLLAGSEIGFSTLAERPHEALRLALFCVNGSILVALCAGLQRGLRRIRSARNEAARQFEIMANNAPVLIWTSDSEGRCVFVNRNWQAFTGRVLEPGGRRPGRFHPGDAARYDAVALEAMSARKPFRLEYRLQRADDEYRWIEENVVPRFGESGRFEGYIGSCNDITDARNEREELTFFSRIQTALTESLDLDVCVDVVARAVVPRVADWCRIQLLDETGQLDYARALHFEAGDDRIHLETAPGANPISPLSRQIIETGQLQRLDGDDTLRREIAQGREHYERLRSVGAIRYLGVPLRSRGRIAGTLEIATAETGRPFGEEVMRLLNKIAGLTSFALENARLYRSACRALAAEAEARRAVENSERRFRCIWETNVFGVGTTDSTGRLRTANEALARLLGISTAAIVAGDANIRDRTPLAWRTTERRAAEELERIGRCTPYETEFLRPDGTTVQVLMTGSVLPESNERIVFVLDLSARKQAERALEQQRLLLTTIVDAMPAMVGYIDLDQRFQLHSERYRKWLGLRADQIDGHTVSEVIGSETYRLIGPYLNAAMRGRTMRHETTLHTATRDRHLIATYRPDRDETGQMLGLVIHAYDITERKEIEQALAEALTRYRFLADAMPQLVWTSDPNGRLDYVNRRWLETTGMTEIATLEPDGWLGAVHFEDRDAARDRWHEALAQCTPFEHECRLRCGKNITWRWHLVRALPRRDALLNVVQWVGSATDVDEQRCAFAELTDARERLKDHATDLELRVRARTETLREANAELEAFTYSVSHDLRTPLQFIRGFAEAIQASAATALTADNVDYLERIIRSAARMETTIHDLLSYSKLTHTEVQLEPLRLEEIVTDVLTEHHAVIQQRSATIVVERPLPCVCADRTGLFQALSNLVSNALKFTRPAESPWVRIRTETVEHSIRVWVEDHGIGIDSREQERIFRLFERLHGHTEYPGTGIGLSLVRKAVARMGGTCGVLSEAGGGSRFWLMFPSACDVMQTLSPQSSPASDSGRVGESPTVN